MTRQPPETYTSAEISSLLRVCCSRSFTGQRAKAIIILAWRAGLRSHEIVSLRTSDISLVTGEIRVLNGKGGKTRTVCIDPGSCAILSNYQERRTPKKCPTWICTLTGSALQTSQIRRTLTNLGMRAKLEKRVHCHGLRHSYAVDLLREGFDVYEISRALGHSSLQTTQIYLDHFSPLALMKKQAARPLVLSEF